MRANKLIVDIRSRENNIEIFYTIDNTFRNSYRIEFPFKIDVSEAMLSTIELWQAIFIAQLCLAKEIILEYPLWQGMVEDISPVLRSVYDIRFFREGLPVDRNIPKISTEFYTSPEVGSLFIPNKKACLTWSGGKDSTYALYLLQKNNYQVTPINFNINCFTSEQERNAVNELGKVMDVDPLYVHFNFPEFLKIASHYSPIFAKPHTHPIPHGRELAMFSAALVIANKYGLSYMCGGIEKETWTSRINYLGNIMFTHDAGNEGIVSVINNFLSKYINKPVRIFSPVAPFADYKVFESVYKHIPQALNHLASCHYGSWCGECSKCTRYDVYQRSLGVEIIKFSCGRKPFEDQNFHLRNFVNDWNNKTALNWMSTQYALYNAVARSKDLDGILKQYYDAGFSHIGAEIEILQKYIYEDYPAAFLPNNWACSFSK